MKIRVVKIFGREVLRVETHEEVTVSDVVAAMLANRAEVVEYEECEECDDEAETCDCCGEELTEDDIIASRFSNMTERIVWDARADEDEDYPEPTTES